MQRPRLTVSLEEIGIRRHEEHLPIYKYTSIETAKAILEKSNLRFRTPSTFNDPFEFNLELFDYDVTIEEFKRKLKNDLKSNTNINEEEVRKIVDNSSIDEYRNAYKAIIELQRHQSLVFCTSEINNDTLMWSHYGNHHRGVCIGLRIPSLDEELDCLTMRVNYTEKISGKRLLTEDSFERMIAIMYWAFTKSNCWSYEKEVRSLIKNVEARIPLSPEGYADVSLNKIQIEEIYFGVNTSDNDINDIKSIIKSYGYTHLTKIGKMKPVRGTFNIVAEY